MIHKYLLFILFLLIHSHIISGEATSYPFRHVSIENGLSHADANTLIQDEKGFIWIGTYSGLDRYDGYQVKSFYNTIDHINKSYLNRISDIAIDSKGMIWLATFSGIQLFNPVLEKFIQIEIINEKPKEGENEIRKIVTINNTYLCIIDKSHQAAIYRIEEDYKLTREPFSLNAKCFDLIVDNSNRTWITTDNGAWCLDKQNNLMQFKFPELSNTVYYIAIHENEGIFAGGENTLFYYPVREKEIQEKKEDEFRNGTKIFLSNDFGHITNIRQENTNSWWISTLKGLYNVKKNNDTFSVVSIYAKDYLNGLNSDYINDLLIDSSENLFIATYGGGVNILNLNRKPFYSLQRIPNTINTIAEKIVRAIADDDKFLWIGSNAMGLTRINKKTGQYDFFHSSNSNLRSNEIRFLKYDEDNNLWVGHTKGIDIIKESQALNPQFMKEQEKPQFPEIEVSCFTTDCYGQIWIGTWFDGICRIRKNERGAFETIFLKHTRPDYPAFTPSRAITIFSDQSTPEIFFSSGEELIRIFLNRNGNVDQTLIYEAGNQKEYSLSSNFICSIERRNDSILWVGSIGGGFSEVTLMADGNYKAINYSQKDGLNIKDVECLETDGEGNVWLAGNELVKFNPSNKSFKTYTVNNNSFYANSYKAGASHKGKNGKLYFGGINGLVYFNPSDIKESNVPAKPEITSLLVNNKNMEMGSQDNEFKLNQNISYAKNITLPYNKNNLTFYFTALNYANPIDCKFRYRLNEYESDFRKTNGHIPFAYYSNLPVGKYELELYASNEDGLWNEHPRTLVIHITPPWWWSVPSKIIYTLLIISILILIIIYFHRWLSLKKKLQFKDMEEKQKERIHQMQLQFFTNISHEFRTPLTLILGVTEQLIQKSGNRKMNFQLETLYSNARRLMRLVNELLDFRKAEAGSFHLAVEQIDINGFTKKITNEFITLAEKKDILFDIQIDQAVHKGWFDPVITEKIMLNLLNNAFKYTKKGGYVQVKILYNMNRHISPFKNSFTIDSEFNAQSYFYINIKDNGIGISKESIEKVFNRYYQVENSEADQHLGSGIGLALVKSLIQIHKGKLIIFSERNKGCEFIAAIPKAKEDFSDNEQVKTETDTEIKDIDSISVLEYINTGEKSAYYPVLSGKTSILLVEDNREVRSFLEESLSAVFDVDSAENGIEALEKIAEKTPDLIISDWMMPKMDGVRFCEQLKEEPEKGCIPFIMLTAKNTLDDRITGTNSGADAYLAKPISIKLLFSTIYNLLSQQDRIKARISSNYLSKAIDDTMQEKDKEFYEQFIQIVEKHLSNVDIDVEALSKELNYSRTKLYQKVKDITGKPVMDMVRTIRLRKATQYMAEEDISMQEIMQKVGIQSQSYFTSAFKKEYGKTPGQFMRDLKKQ